jgi:protein SCO1/2
MDNPRLLRTVAVFFVLLLPFALFIYFEGNKPPPVRPPKMYKKVPYFRLINQEGDTVSSDDLKGYIYLCDFFYTHCPGICPKLTAFLSRIHYSYYADKRLKIISFTVDPERDSVSVLKAYAKKYNANPFKWNFLTGPKKDIYNLAVNGFMLPLGQATPGDTELTHSDRVVLVDAAGNIRGYYGVFSDTTLVDSVYNDIEKLLVERPKQ